VSYDSKFLISVFNIARRGNVSLYRTYQFKTLSPVAVLKFLLLVGCKI